MNFINEIKSWLQDNEIEMYSMRNEVKSIAAEKFILILRDNVYKYVTSIFKNKYLVVQLMNTILNIIKILK